MIYRLYTRGALHLAGYDVTLADIRSFRQLGSHCAGHPARGLLPGVEVTTGPLGREWPTRSGWPWPSGCWPPGLTPKDSRWLIIAPSPSAVMEGVASEACSLAGRLDLGELTLLYDDNRVSLLGVVSHHRKPDAPRSCHRTCPGSRWRRPARSAGRSWTDQMVGLTTFGASGKGPDLYRDFGLTPKRSPPSPTGHRPSPISSPGSTGAPMNPRNYSISPGRVVVGLD